MYAAAGGASLASRQARQRQRQQKKQQLQAKLHPPKVPAAAVVEHGASTPTRGQSRQFHQLPSNYLRTPQAQARKLSASYTAQSKLLLPIDEGDTQSVLNMRMHSHGHAAIQHSHSHSHAQQQHLPHIQQQQSQSQFQGIGAQFGKHFQHTQFHGHSHGRVSPKLVHRHSGSSGTSFHQSHLPKSATATLPLVSQVEATPPTSPSGAAVAIKTAMTAPAAGTPTTMTTIEAISLPQPHDAIIVTPATPMASPGHVAKIRDEDLSQAAEAERQPLTAGEIADDEQDDEPMQPPTGPLERKCSVYRMRRSDAFEHEVAVGAGSGVKRQLRELQFNNQQQQYEPLIPIDEPQLLFKGIGNGRKWQICAYCEEGICVCEHIECAQGRAAWLERGRRCSVQETPQQQQQQQAHRRWVKRNRVQDASLGGSSDDEDFLGVLRGPSTFANAFLYVGLGTVALGLVIAFVGTGEKGFKTVELRLIGPSLIGIGLICCILRILFCICPSHCIASSKKNRKKNGNKVDVDHTTSLLRGESKRVSIARAPSMQPKYPLTHKRSQSRMLNDGMEALRQIATTSLFMQNEKQPLNRIVPIINEPESAEEAALEMKKLDSGFNVDIDEHENASEFIKEKITAIATTILSKTNNNTTTESAVATTIANTAATKILTETSKTLISQQKTSTSITIASAAAKDNTEALFTKKGTPTTTTGPTKSSLANKTSEHALPPPLGTVSNSVGKLTRQRVAFNQNEPPKTHERIMQSQSLSSSSTVKDSIDGDLLMETSLMVATPVKSSLEDRPPQTLATMSLPFASIPTTETQSTVTPVYTGAVSRTTIYDLPPAMPHTYAATTTSYAAAAASCTRIGSADRDTHTLIRGPLGMTASPSAYTLPSSASTTPITTPSVNTVTTSKSLLPLTSSNVGSTATQQQEQQQNQQKQQQTHTPIPGQVFDNVPSTSIYTRLTSTAQSAQGTPLTSTLHTTQFNFPTQQTGTSNSSMPGSNISTTLAPPLQPNVNKFEPELLLSPAKLGQ